MLKGYKSYILAVLAVIYGVSAYFTGNASLEVALASVWGGLSVFAIRNAIR